MCDADRSMEAQTFPARKAKMQNISDIPGAVRPVAMP